jgi:hypothetical protein
MCGLQFAGIEPAKVSAKLLVVLAATLVHGSIVALLSQLTTYACWQYDGLLLASKQDFGCTMSCFGTCTLHFVALSSQSACPAILFTQHVQCLWDVSCAATLLKKFSQGLLHACCAAEAVGTAAVWFVRLMPTHGLSCTCPHVCPCQQWAWCWAHEGLQANTYACG